MTYASMKEVVRWWRYGRAIEEPISPPDFDYNRRGGKGKWKRLLLGGRRCLGLSIPIAGLAKDGKHRTSELLFGFPPVTVGNTRLDSPLFHLLTRIQEEVHPFRHHSPQG